ncbi:MAG TPA: hypothetical protein VN554_02515 [Verrucomicrobiae bacterium]|nr:hypothetical protein [Verrucomicrobiae bacterium]
MGKLEQQRFTGTHSAEDTWQALNTPLTGDLGEAVNPFVTISYEGLGDEGLVRPGTLIVYIPDTERIRTHLGAIADMLPDDVAMRVEDYDPDARTRRDVVVSDKYGGELRYGVEDTGETGLLTVEGELLLGGMYKMVDGTITSYAQRGLAAHYGRVLEHVPTILGQDA